MKNKTDFKQTGANKQTQPQQQKDVRDLKDKKIDKIQTQTQDKRLQDQDVE
jgi:hypothetical protein